MKRQLIIYARRPLPGQAKTRLAADIGMEQAAGVYARMLYAYLADLLDADLLGARVQLQVASPADVPFFAAAFPEWTVDTQVEGHLGDRLAASFAHAFAEGATNVVVTASDVPALRRSHVRQAFVTLERTQVVLGPSADGGYYLLGMRSPGWDLFRGVSWSTSQVLAQTVALAQSLGLTVGHMSACLDIDNGADYEVWQQAVARDQD